MSQNRIFLLILHTKTYNFQRQFNFLKQLLELLYNMTVKNSLEPSLSNGEKVVSRRLRRKVEREEKSVNHGASKKVRVSVEQEYEERYDTNVEECVYQKPDGSLMLQAPGHQPTSLEDILSQEIIDELPKKEIEDADYEEVTDNMNTQETGNKTRKDDERRVDEETQKTYKEDANKVNLAATRKKRMSEKAAEILKSTIDNKRDLVLLNQYGLEIKQDTVYTHSITEYKGKDARKRCETYSTEYWEDPVFDATLDFSMFGSPEQFKEFINLEGKTVVECITQYVDEKSVKNKNYRKRYRMILTYILMLEDEWNIKLYPQVIGALFWSKFERYLYNQGLSPHSVEQLFCNLRAVLKWSTRYGAKVKSDMEEIKYRGVDAKPKIALTEDDISHIYWFDIDSLKCRSHHKKTLRVVRDHFVLSCFLGQRYSDTVRLDQTNFRGQEIFKVTQLKTGSTAVLEFNRLYTEYPPHVKDILERYDYKSPWQGDISNYNRYLHELMKRIGFNADIKYEYKVAGVMISKNFKKWELISSHVARRTFITNAVKRGINTQYIKRASGHHSDESFGKYVIFNDNID